MLAEATQHHFSQTILEKTIPWSLAFRRAMEEWYTWGVISIGVIWLAEHVPFERGKRGRWFLVHGIASVTVSVIYAAIYSWLLDGQRSIDGTIFKFSELFHKVTVFYTHFHALIYWMIVLIEHGWEYYERYRQREVEAAELQGQLVQAKLEALRMQLNPHFLFNTLHTISSFIHVNPETADRMIARLSDLLRLSLDHNDKQEVPLSQELAFLEAYLEIERIRFEERLSVEIDIPPETRRALVPSLILQPLVENAIRHGIERREESGRVAIQARRTDGMLELNVSDNGSGLPERDAGLRREGIGLSNTRSRLRHLYGDNHRLELTEAPGGGFEVRLAIPFRDQNQVHLPNNG